MSLPKETEEKPELFLRKNSALYKSDPCYQVDVGSNLEMKCSAPNKIIYDNLDPLKLLCKDGVIAKKPDNVTCRDHLECKNLPASLDASVMQLADVNATVREYQTAEFICQPGMSSFF